MLLRALAAAAVLAAAALPSSAEGRPLPLRLVPTPVQTSGVTTDGDRFLLLLPGGQAPVIVLDLAGGVRPSSVVPPLPLCSVADVHAGELLWRCAGPGYASVGAVTDLRTGATTPLPSLSSFAEYKGGEMVDGASYSRIGIRWVEVSITSYHAARHLWLDRVTGAFVPEPQGGFKQTRQVDPDAAVLTRALCAPVLRPLVPDAFIGYEPGLLVERGGWFSGRGVDADGADVPARLLLQRCGRPRIVLRKTADAIHLSEPVLGDGFVAWTEQRKGTPKEVGASSLVVRTLRTGVTRRLALGWRTATPYAVGARLYLHRFGGALERVALGRL